MSKNLITRTTIQNLATELNNTFAKKTELTAASNAAAAALKSGKVDGNTVKLFTSQDATGTAAFSFDFPVEMVLDQAKTAFVPSFAFAAATYPGATDPGLEGKPVMVLAVKGSDGSVTYSFMDMAKLVDTYKAKATGKDASTTITIAGYEIEVKVNISAEADNQIQMKGDGLYVPKPAAVDLSGKADKDTDAVEGNLASFDANGNPVDSGVPATDVVTSDDISDYTAEEIAAMLADEDATE